uniref:Uncharacterized protein n=1 Tax=Cacopsylla melanoneura TaxID=428564 RepID=A0A8D8Y680_9HEMI
METPFSPFCLGEKKLVFPQSLIDLSPSRTSNTSMLIILYLCQPDQYVYLFGDVLDLKGLRLTQTVLFSYFFAFFTRKCENANLGDLPDRGGQGSSIKIFPATKIVKFNVGYHI